MSTHVNATQVLWSAPETERSGKPLLVLMHGWSYDETHLFRLLTPRLPAPVVVASLRAPVPEAGGFAWFPSHGNPIGDPQPAVANSATNGVLDWLDAQRDFSSVGVGGFSQGGAMALQLMRHVPERFAYGIQLGGFVVNDTQPGDGILRERRPPVFWGRGARDGVIPRNAVERTARWLNAHTTTDVRVYQGLGHDVAGQEVADAVDFVRQQT